MEETVIRKETGSEYLFQENCHITEIYNTSGDPDVSIARARVEPGITTRWHRLADTVERYYIISGRGRVEVGELVVQEVKTGDMVLIPPMVRQRISNIGAEDLIFLAVCTPRFTTENYEDIKDNPA
jgi:mannose-6-phosphate isomerase-like protein (cupin superfamily)